MNAAALQEHQLASIRGGWVVPVPVVSDCQCFQAKLALRMKAASGMLNHFQASFHRHLQTGTREAQLADKMATSAQTDSEAAHTHTGQ